MTGLGRLFSFRGRMDRLAFWRAQVGLLVLMALFWCGGLLLADVTGVGALSAIALVGCAFLYWPVLALLCRRLHDRDKSAWWIVPFQIAPVALDLMVETNPRGASAGGLLPLAGFALLVWGFVEIGLLRGTRGPNQYGPEPAPGAA